MSSTVSVGGFEISSNHESAEDIVKALTPAKDDAPAPKILINKGQDVRDEPEKDPAAVALGKKGAAAAAEKRAADAKAEKSEKPEKKAAPEKPEPKDEKAEPEGAEEGKGDGKDPKKGNPRHDPQARVAEATRELAEERRQRAEERQQLLARLDAMEQRLSKPQTDDERKALEGRHERLDQRLNEPAKPTPDQFKEYEQYIEVLTDWKADQRERRRSVEEQASQMQLGQQSEAEARARGFAKQLEDAGVHDKVDKRLTALVPSGLLPPGSPVGPSNLVADALSRLDKNAAVVAMHFTENPDVLMEMVNRCMTEAQKGHEHPAVAFRSAFALELGRLEGRLERESDADAPKQQGSRAKPPVKPVTASSGTPEADVHGKLDLDSFMSRVPAGRRPKAW